MDTVISMNRRRVVIGLVLAVVALCLPFAVLKQAQPAYAEMFERALVLCDEDPAQAEFCGEDAVTASLKNGYDPVDMLKHLNARYTAHLPMPMLCHNAFHQVGHSIDMSKQSLKPYLPYMTDCMMGLLDGIVEAQDFNEDTAVAAASLSKFCADLDAQIPDSVIIGEPYRYCWHPIGHGLWKSYEPIEKGDQVSNAGATPGMERFWCTHAMRMQAGNLHDNAPLPSVTEIAMAEIDTRCRVIARGDADSFEGCRAAYLREILGKQEELIKPFYAKCATYVEMTRKLCREAAAETTDSAYISKKKTMLEAFELYCPTSDLHPECFDKTADFLIRSEHYTADEAWAILEPVAQKVEPSYLPKLRKLLVTQFGMAPGTSPTK